MFCKHFSKNMSMVSPTHCWTNCAEVDLPLCLPCVFRFSSVFVLSLLFIFIFVSFFSFYFIWRRHRWNSNWLVAMPRCLLFLCASSGFQRNHTLVIVGSCGHRRIDWAIGRLKELANLLSGGKLSLYFLSIGRATNCLWHNRNRNSCFRRDSSWICPEFIIYFSLFLSSLDSEQCRWLQKLTNGIGLLDSSWFSGISIVVTARAKIAPVTILSVFMLKFKFNWNRLWWVSYVDSISSFI